ncbi:MAG: DUF2232 domain-containing protein [Xanthobacteraceae bacterium]
MVQIIIVGIAAGAAAALLFASVISGSFASVFLFYLAPLPVLIAALGWSHLAGLIAAAFASAMAFAMPGAFLTVVPITAFGAWWLGYLTLLARPSPNAATTDLEWYPIGRLVLWAAVLGTVLIAAALPKFGNDVQSLQRALRSTYEHLLQGLADQSLIEMLVVVVPAAAAVFSTVTYLFNLWLAARIVRISGRLKRPWPEVSGLALPWSASGLLAVALVGSFLSGVVGVLSAALAASLLMAFALLGLAVLHAITRGMSARPALVGSAYAAALMLGWPLLALSAVGLAEAMFGIRVRVARRRVPPSLRT